ncbi:CPX1 [Symbiodinium sp. CCMP2592]|nr:CPX1 [Symbiodinium sp. CCMP2592]
MASRQRPVDAFKVAAAAAATAGATAFVTSAGQSVTSQSTAPRAGIAPAVSATATSAQSFSAPSHALPALAGAAVLAGGRRRMRKRMAVRSAAAVMEKYTSMCKDSDPPESMRRRFEAVVAQAQEDICKAIEDCDGGAKFCKEPYTRGDRGGGGIARVLRNGNVFEKAGVNLSVVYGEMPESALNAATERGADRAGGKLKPGQKVPFFACGLSSVMHPKNPHCPTMHFNYRYFETETGQWWFGGGTDITPSYLDKDDMKHFHGTYKDVCDKYDPEWYSKFKKWADEYFLIQHRQETRGLGGIFFDDFNTEDPETHLKFSTDCLASVAKAYVPILEKNKDKEYTDEQKQWQLVRRGRYVEFNLVYDRGTVFGLKMLSSGVGRIESILMSLPENAKWLYAHEPEEGSPEAEIMEAFKTPQEWV